MTLLLKLSTVFQYYNKNRGRLGGLISCARLILYRAHDILSPVHDLLVHMHELVISCARHIISCARLNISCARLIISFARLKYLACTTYYLVRTTFLARCPFKVSVGSSVFIIYVYHMTGFRHASNNSVWSLGHISLLMSSAFAQEAQEFRV